jgi:nucleoside-diphosphate-sugar epimerase
VGDKDVIIVTGSCGRIGSNVVVRLGNDYRIVGFELLKALYASANEELVPVDLSSDESVHQAFMHIRHFYGNRIASVIHLAAYYSFDQEHSVNYERVTVKGTERLLKALAGFEVEQFIFSSTMLVYAPTAPGQPINEESKVMAKWDYPLSKVHTEKLIHDLRGKISTVILRIAGVYDDICHSIPISHQIQRIYENQLESRLFSGDITHGAAFLHMADLVEAIALAVDKRKTLPSELVLLIGERETLSYDALQRQISRLIRGEEFMTFRVPKSIAKIGAWVQEHLPFIEKPFVKPWMIALADDHYELDISRAKQILGWQPNHSLKETLPKMVEALKKDPAKWYRQNQLTLSPRIAKKIAEGKM